MKMSQDWTSLFAVHEVSKTLASPRDADLRRLRRVDRYLMGTQKLGIMIRKSKDPEDLDAYADADWRFNQQKEYLR